MPARVEHQVLFVLRPATVIADGVVDIDGLTVLSRDDVTHGLAVGEYREALRGCRVRAGRDADRNAARQSALISISLPNGLIRAQW